VGSDRQHRVDVRVIAATNRDLKAEVAAGRFRSDLYHRLSVYPMVVPPLRERGEDILMLAGYFLERNQRRLGLRGARLSRSARQWLMQYSWPGNVRELEHTLSRALIRALSVARSKGRIIELTTQHLGAEPLTSSAAPAHPDLPGSDERTLAEAVEQIRRDLVQLRLREHGGNRASAARSLGIDRGNFYRLLKKLGLDA
jgi:anaerobic nitric oxide reductase transcription regulator